MEEMVTAREIKKAFGIPHMTLYRMAETGLIPCHHPEPKPWHHRRSFLFVLNEVEAALEKMGTTTDVTTAAQYKPLIRRNVTGQLRQEVIRRDSRRCRYCGSDLKGRTVHIDHILPYVRDGATEWDNLATSCRACNAHKSDRTPEEAGMVLLPIPGISANKTP